jgi:hypothetical protein
VNLVPPVIGTVQYMDRTLNYWYKDVEGLLAGQIAKEHINQPGFSYASVDFVIGADHGQGSFRASVKIIFHHDDGSIEATAISGLGEIECQKDTAELLALAFTLMLNATLKRIVSYVRSDDGQLISDGTLAIYNKKENLPRQGAERKTEEAGERNPQGAEGEAPSDPNFNQGAEGDPETDVVKQTSTFYAILDRTGQLGDEDTLVLNVPILALITGDLAFLCNCGGEGGHG